MISKQECFSLFLSPYCDASKCVNDNNMTCMMNVFFLFVHLNLNIDLMCETHTHTKMHKINWRRIIKTVKSILLTLESIEGGFLVLRFELNFQQEANQVSKKIKFHRTMTFLRQYPRIWIDLISSRTHAGTQTNTQIKWNQLENLCTRWIRCCWLLCIHQVKHPTFIRLFEKMFVYSNWMENRVEM